jgi:hypothetical protein
LQVPVPVLKKKEPGNGVGVTSTVPYPNAVGLAANLGPFAAAFRSEVMFCVEPVAGALTLKQPEVAFGQIVYFHCDPEGLMAAVVGIEAEKAPEPLREPVNKALF